MEELVSGISFYFETDLDMTALDVSLYKTYNDPRASPSWVHIALRRYVYLYNFF